jgi:prophage DNA circulation protein
MSEKKETTKESLKLSSDEIEAIKSLEESIQNLHTNVSFSSNTFKGNVEQVQELMETTAKALTIDAEGMKKLLENYSKIRKELDKQIATLSLLPQKTQESLTKIVPEISKEIEKIHDQRMVGIKSTLEDLQKKFSQSVLEKQIYLEEIANKNIEQIKKLQQEQIKQQEKIFRQVVYHTKKEVEAVTANHGSKFLRNTAICLILAAITGCLSGWYVNRYMPKFVTLEKTGDITIHGSNVKVLEAPKLNKNDSFKK